MADANDIDVVAARTEWSRATEAAQLVGIRSLCTSTMLDACALFQRVAKADPSDDGQAAARWLSSMGLGLTMLVPMVNSTVGDISGGMGVITPMANSKVQAGNSANSRK